MAQDVDDIVGSSAEVRRTNSSKFALRFSMESLPPEV